MLSTTLPSDPFSQSIPKHLTRLFLLQTLGHSNLPVKKYIIQSLKKTGSELPVCSNSQTLPSREAGGAGSPLAVTGTPPQLEMAVGRQPLQS